MRPKDETAHLDIEVIDSLIQSTLDKCMSWLGSDPSGNTVVVDPLEGESIYAHYSNSHLAAALILGWDPSSEFFRRGLDLVSSILDRWPHDSKLPSFHSDFNNMALCLIEERLEALQVNGVIRNAIRSTVLTSADSPHFTINWLPMRMYVNAKRFEWTGDDAWRKAAARSARKIKKATNRDGFIEDRLPRGTSFNLQYDVSTVALLSFLNNRGLASDLSVPLIALLNAVSPDGDINYLGRGSNQIFGWGPWLYLLKTTGQGDAFTEALSYLRRHLPTMLDNNNLLLNDLEGAARDGWWDYHYASVYTCHLLLWLVMARAATAPADEPHIPKSPSYGADSGVSILRGQDHFVVTFSGRSEYLAERGPVVAALWTRASGMAHKGEFGSWLGMFGQKHAGMSTVLNHFGLYSVRRDSFVPQFVPIEVLPSRGDLIIRFTANRKLNHIMNIPLLSGAEGGVHLLVDGEECPLREAGSIVTMYGSKSLLQSEPRRASNWEVRVPR